MVTRIELEAREKRARSNLSSKRIQIKESKKKAGFRGVTISDQFREGRAGIKPFRARRKIERKLALIDLGIFSKDIVGLESSLKITKKDLFDFNNGMVGL